MWACGFCGAQSEHDDRRACQRCLVRRGENAIRGDSLFVTHATSAAAFEGIRARGFELRNMAAGRSLGDVIYGYVYDGGSTFGSMQHAVNVCRTTGQSEVVVMRIAPALGRDRIFVLDQPAWERALDQSDGSLTNYQAFLQSHPGNEEMARLAALAKAQRLDEIRNQPYSRTEVELRDEAQRLDAELNRFAALARSAKADEQRALSSAMAMTFANIEQVAQKQERLAENFREDKLCELAHVSEYDGFYNLETRIIVFFDPPAVIPVEPLVALEVPSVLLANDPATAEERKKATATLTSAADSACGAAFAEFLGASPSGPSVSSVPLPQSLVALGDLGSGVQACSSSDI